MQDEQRRCMGCMQELSWDGQCHHCGFRETEYVADVHHLPPGTRLQNGEYTAGRVLGEGGFGITYIGFDETLLDVVAIKEYYPAGMVERDTSFQGNLDVHVHGDSEQEYEKGKQNFLQEARLLARFSQLEGVVNVRKCFQENETVYIVMEYIRGESIRSYVDRQGAIPADRALAMLRPVIRTLHRIHEKQLIHRDVSADNLLIREDGKVILIDFGAVRTSNAVKKDTRTTMYKPGFSALEQYSRTGVQGPWTDVYGVCATIYYMLTGVVPVNCTERVGHDPLLSLAEQDGIPLSIEQKQAIMKGMEVQAGDRFQTMALLYEVLYSKQEEDGFRQEEKIQTDRQGTPPTAVFTKTTMRQKLEELSNSRKRKRKMFLLVLLLVICAALYPGMRWLLKESPREETTTVEPVKESSPKPSSEPTSTAPVSTPTPATKEKMATVPRLKGLTQKQAMAALKKKGLSGKTGFRYSKEKKGLVLSQKVKAGTEVTKGKTISFVVSKGEKTSKPTAKPTAKSTAKPVKPSNQDKLAGDLDDFLQGG